jgi:hypothetical protein
MQIVNVKTIAKSSVKFMAHFALSTVVTIFTLVLVFMVLVAVRAKYGLDVPAAIRSMKITRVPTSFQSPWQNGVAERWVESCRRGLLDHVIALNERHLRRFCPSTSRITMRTERILGCARERRAAESVLRRPAWCLPCAIGRFTPSLRPGSLKLTGTTMHLSRVLVDLSLLSAAGFRKSAGIQTGRAPTVVLGRRLPRIRTLPGAPFIVANDRIETNSK